MEKDRWYKRIAWFLFFSIITLAIFYVLDWGFRKFADAYTDTTFEAKFEQDTYTVKEGDLLYFRVVTDARKFTFDIWIDDIDLDLVVDNENEVTINLKDYEIELLPGTYTVKSSVIGKRGLGREREVPITTTLIVLPKE